MNEDNSIIYLRQKYISVIVSFFNKAYQSRITDSDSKIRNNIISKLNKATFSNIDNINLYFKNNIHNEEDLIFLAEKIYLKTVSEHYCNYIFDIDKEKKLECLLKIYKNDDAIELNEVVALIIFSNTNYNKFYNFFKNNITEIELKNYFINIWNENIEEISILTNHTKEHIQDLIFNNLLKADDNTKKIFFDNKKKYLFQNTISLFKNNETFINKLLSLCKEKIEEEDIVPKQLVSTFNEFYDTYYHYKSRIAKLRDEIKTLSKTMQSCTSHNDFMIKLKDDISNINKERYDLEVKIKNLNYSDDDKDAFYNNSVNELAKLYNNHLGNIKLILVLFSSRIINIKVILYVIKNIMYKIILFFNKNNRNKEHVSYERENLLYNINLFIEVKDYFFKTPLKDAQNQDIEQLLNKARIKLKELTNELTENGIIKEKLNYCIN